MRLLDSLEAIIEAIVGRRLDYHALYPCTVASQASDGTLDLIPDDAKIKGTGTSGIKLRHGLPGFTATVPTGARVLMGFEAGDPKRPYAMAWDAGSVTSVTFDGGTAAVGRVGDSVDIGAWQATVAAGAITAITVTPPGGGIPVPIPVAPALPLSLAAEISSGNTKLKA